MYIYKYIYRRYIYIYCIYILYIYCMCIYIYILYVYIYIYCMCIYIYIFIYIRPWEFPFLRVFIYACRITAARQKTGAPPPAAPPAGAPPSCDRCSTRASSVMTGRGVASLWYPPKKFQICRARFFYFLLPGLDLETPSGGHCVYRRLFLLILNK